MPTTSRSESPYRAAMRYYRSIGFNPVPSRMRGKKAPAVKVKPFWSVPGPDWWLDMPTTNIQVMTGSHWRLIAVDLDGPIALEIWRAWTLYRESPPTWEVASDPATGKHLWFRLPVSTPSVSSRIAWKLDGVKHGMIEIKGDNALIIAPPSVHIRTGLPYRFLPRRDPRTIRRPALAPAWLVNLPAVRDHRQLSLSTFTPRPVLSPRPASSERHDWRDVLASIPDRRLVAEGWGLRIVGTNPDADGWLQCRAIGREDSNPSAGFNVRTGYYCEPATNYKLSFFDISVETGHHRNWQDACNELGDLYLAPRTAPCRSTRIVTTRSPLTLPCPATPN